MRCRWLLVFVTPALGCGDRRPEMPPAATAALPAPASAEVPLLLGEWPMPDGHCGGVLLHNGGVAVCDRGLRRVRWLEPLPAPGGQFREPKEGPSPGAAVAALWRLATDTLLVLYRGGASADFVSEAGTPLRSVSYPHDPTPAISRRFVGALPGGTLVYELRHPGMTATRIRELGTVEAAIPTRIQLRLVGPSGPPSVLVDTTFSQEFSVIVDAAAAVYPPPLAPRLLTAVVADEVYVTDSHAGVVRRYAPDGGMVHESKWPQQQRTASAEELALVVEAFVAHGSPATAAHRARVAELHFKGPGVLPTVEHLGATQEGELLASDFALPSEQWRTWRILSPELRQTEAFRLPLAETVLAVSSDAILTFDSVRAVLSVRRRGDATAHPMPSAAVSDARLESPTTLCATQSVPSHTLGSDSVWFGEITDARVLTSSVAVLDRLERTVRVFDLNGSLQWQAGRPGSGPEEFERPVSLATIPGDTLLVYDAALGRYSLLFDGRVVRTVAVPWEVRLGRPLARVNDSTIIATVAVSAGGGSTEGIRADSVDAFVVMGHRRVVELGRFPAAVRYFNLQGAFTVLLVPWAPYTSFAVLADELLLATGLDPEILLLGLDGGSMRRLPTGTDARPVKADDWRAKAGELSAGAGGAVAYERLFRLATIPGSTPFYEAVRVSSAGEVWIRHSRLRSTEGVIYTVLNARGVVLERASFPPRSEVMDARASWVAVRTDSAEGVPLLVLFHRRCAARA